MKFLKTADVIILIVVSAGAIGISILHVLDLFPALEHLIHVDYMLLAVVLLGLLGVHLGVAHYETERSREATDEELKKITGRLQGSSVRLFANMADLEVYLAQRIHAAKTEVCDFSWKRRFSPSFGVGKRKSSHQEYEASIKSASKEIIYREIFIFTDQRRIEKLKRRIAENRVGYSCRYYEEDSRAPRLEFILIDDCEAVFFATAPGSPMCVFESTELVRVLKPYFEEAWVNAIPIKDGLVLHRENYDRILAMSAQGTQGG